MARCRVYALADGTLAVVTPADPEAFDRAMARTEAVNPALAGRPYVDCDVADLPDRGTREAWRLNAGKVVAP